MAKELKFVMLLDCYGDLLTDHQRSIIKRTEDILLNYEEKLGFAERLGKMRECFGRIEAAAEHITDENIKNTIISEAEKGTEML